MSTAVRVAELESLFTADVRPFEQAAVRVETRKRTLKKDVDVKVDAQTQGATAGMDRVEARAKQLTAQDVIARVDANIASAEKKAEKIRVDLAVLEATDATPQVDADIAKARAALGQVEASIKQLQGTRARLEVVADTSGAERALDDVANQASEGGRQAGEAAGGNLAGGIIAAIATIPVAGAIVGIGKAIGDSLLEGLQYEVREDRLMATTGLDAVTVGRLGRAAAEAYADNFGESIADNMETARIAVQSGLLDPEDTKRDAQAVISSLAGVADIIGEDIARVARSTTTLLRNGLAETADDAFDIIVKGQQAGLNVSEDWLDTLDEYSTMFRSLGLTAPQALGLMRQAVQAGARDTDKAADALKEFQIRATDASVASAEGFRLLGLDAREMTDQIAAGGQGAAAGLELVLDRLRETEDPVTRNAAAVALFGTQAEDLGQAMFAMDLSNAVEQLGAVEGAARSAIGVLYDNAANDVATAQRNIAVATDGIKGALAAAFNPQIEDFSTWVSGNREQVMRFLLDLSNGALDFARTFVDGTASATEGVGGFIGGPLADLIVALGDVVYGIDAATPGDQHGQAFREWATNAAAGMRDVEEQAGVLAETMRTEIIENGIDPAQAKLNEFAIPLLAEAALHDASMRLAADLDSVGFAADGAKLNLMNLDLANLGASESGRTLNEQLVAVAHGLDEQIRKGLEAGLTQEELQEQYDASRQALLDQLVAMGLTEQQAADLITQYGLIPERVDTVVAAETATAQADVDSFIARNQGKVIRLTAQVSTSGNQIYVTAAGTRLEGRGHVLEPMAAGALDPMDPVAQVVAPGTLRVVGDRLDVDEAYIPLDGSPRSWAILREALRRMPGAMAAGALVPAGPATGPVGGDTVNVTVNVDVSRLRSLADLEAFIANIRRLARQKAGVSAA